MVAAAITSAACAHYIVWEKRKFIMKVKFNFDLTAEGCKITANDLTVDIGQINCPIGVECELEPAEIQQSIGLIRDLAKEIPNLMKQRQEGELELVEKRAKIDEHIQRVRHQLESDNIRLKADLAEKASSYNSEVHKEAHELQPKQ